MSRIFNLDMREVRFVLPHTNLDTISGVAEEDKDKGTMVLVVKNYRNLEGTTAVIGTQKYDVKFIKEDNRVGVGVSQSYKYRLTKKKVPSKKKVTEKKE